MRAAIYARVSTADKSQNPTTQLLPLRAFVRDSKWRLVGEYVDRASAVNLRARVQWRRLLDHAAQRKLDVIVVWKMDRAFRSVADAVNTVQRLRKWRVGLRSYTEPWMDTSGTSPGGELVFNILTSVAEFERGIISERIKAGLARARQQGKPIGHHRVVPANWPRVRAQLKSGQLTWREATKRLGRSRSTLARLLREENEHA